MGRLIYSLNVSLDGFVETPEHGLEWATVDDELHSWFNDQIRSLDASLYGRRLYELMAGAWPRGEEDPAATPAMREFSRLWKPLPKIVFSSTLEHVDHNARLVRGERFRNWLCPSSPEGHEPLDPQPTGRWHVRHRHTASRSARDRQICCHNARF